VAACLAAAACDKDPTQPTASLALVSCPAGLLGVNAPIALSFTQPLSPSSVSGANVVVTDAITGFEIPGSVRLAAGDAKQVIFTPSEQLAYNTAVRVRVQNLLSQDASSSLNVTVCDLRTQLPPITELFWRTLPNAGGNTLLGLSLVNPTYGFVAAQSNRVFRYADSSSASTPTTLTVPPYYTSMNDVSFVSTTHGFASVTETRARRSVVLETFDGGVTYDTIGSASAEVLIRAYFRPIPDATTPFGVVAGGQTFSPAYFMKYHPATKTFTVSSFSGTGGVNDLDFTTDTTLGAAATLGIQLGTRSILGTIFTSHDGGSSWQEVAGAVAPDSVLLYKGIAVKASGEVWVTGGNGYVAKLSPSGGGYTITRVILPGVTSLQPGNPYALIYNDVQFAPADPQVGWIVGARQVGTIGGVPRYEGLIFATRDGGATWIRQGVTDAANFGAEFPALNRIDVLSPTTAWIVGEGGTVLRYAGVNTP
jgi:hypothetical protein